MSGAQVSLFRSTVEGLAEGMDKSASLIGFIGEQLILIHEKKESALTVFQLAAMLELIDSDLMRNSALLGSALS